MPGQWAAPKPAVNRGCDCRALQLDVEDLRCDVLAKVAGGHRPLDESGNPCVNVVSPGEKDGKLLKVLINHDHMLPPGTTTGTWHRLNRRPGVAAATGPATPRKKRTAMLDMRAPRPPGQRSSAMPQATSHSDQAM
jgi:hypothetical protein